ncbi:MAG: hypothetical protein LBJ88_03640 [Campylobacteraceae bacterium]|nr:hypothetical protein [Campylobacteraceae bacterium]
MTQLFSVIANKAQQSIFTCKAFHIFRLPRRVAPRNDTIMILCHCELPKSAWQSSEIDKEPFFHNPFRYFYLTCKDFYGYIFSAYMLKPNDYGKTITFILIFDIITKIHL